MVFALHEVYAQKLFYISHGVESCSTGPFDALCYYKVAGEKFGFIRILFDGVLPFLVALKIKTEKEKD